MLVVMIDVKIQMVDAKVQMMEEKIQTLKVKWMSFLHASRLILGMVT